MAVPRKLLRLFSGDLELKQRRDFLLKPREKQRQHRYY